MKSKLSAPRTSNQAALRRLRPAIDAAYSKRRFVAIGEGRILADASTFEELETLLRGMGRRPGQSLVVEVGAELPDQVTIFLQALGRMVGCDDPGSGLSGLVQASGNDQVATAAQHSDPRFLGLAGLPLLRKLQYGGDADVFWLRRPAAPRSANKRKPDGNGQ